MSMTPRAERWLTMAEYARSMADCNAAAHLADAAVAFLRAHRAAKN
jgi:hypothetical protein